MSTLIQDLRFALRSFAKNPGFTAVVIVSVALGIAANTTVFSVVNGLLLSSADVGDPGTLFTLNEARSYSWPDYLDYRDGTTGKVFDGGTAFFPVVPASIGGRGEPERVWGQLVTANYFEVLRVRPVLGRGFLPEEDAVDRRNPVVVLGHALWQRRFGADRNLDTAGGKRSANSDLYRVGRDFFRTLGIPVLRGRDFENRDGARAAIINEQMAEKLFGQSDPIGQRIRSGDSSYEVIAVVKRAKSRTLGEEPRACVYLPLESAPENVLSFFGISVVAKTSGNAGQYARAIRGQLLALDSTLAVTSTETMQEHLDKALLLPKICATLLGVFGGVGLTLATVGLYGVLSFAVRARTREIGIRMALGAAHTGVLGMVARQGLILAGAGIAVGLALSWTVTRFAASLLYGVDAHDAVTFLGVPVSLLIVALCAVLGPARRASRVQPMTALRYE